VPRVAQSASDGRVAALVGEEAHRAPTVVSGGLYHIQSAEIPS
jgi:hypothetical protein